MEKKKIGILFGRENTFPQAFVERVNSLAPASIEAELAHVNEVIQGRGADYAVLIDRISQDIPFYRSFLKNAALHGTSVINNPFWWSADEKFFNNCLADELKIPVPKTVLLPSKDMPHDTSSESFRNLKYPLDWDMIIDHLGGFPLYLKPHSGGGWKSVYKVKSKEDLFNAYSQTGRLVMMLQEEIAFDSYYRCYYLGGDRVHIMPYEPRNPHHLRYIQATVDWESDLIQKIRHYTIVLNQSLGYDFNTVEFALREGTPYAIDFCNPAPDAEKTSVGEENFEWIVNNAAEMAIEYASKHEKNKINLTWGNFVKKGVKGKILSGNHGSIS